MRRHKGLLVKIRKTFGHSSTLFKPRSKALKKALASFEKKLHRDKGIQKKLNQLGMSNNLLTSAGIREKLTKGMEELEAEGWIKPEEKATILDTYIKNTHS